MGDAVLWLLCSRLQALDHHGVSGRWILSRSTQSRDLLRGTYRSDLQGIAPRFRLSPQRGNHPPGHQSRQHSPLQFRKSQTCRFRCRRSAYEYSETYFRGYPFLDGAGGYQASRLRCESRYMEFGHHCYRDGQG